MAGIGSRYSSQGYLLPKMLLPISGVPMIIRAIRDMPKSDKWIFIVRKEHIDIFGIDRIIQKEIPRAILIPVNQTTDGQACSALLAEPFLEPDESVFLAACDNGYLFDSIKYNQLLNDEKIDAIIWTFTQQDILKQNPNAWGWVKLDADNRTVITVSIKKPISANVYEDHAVVASFYFRKSKDLFEAIKLMIREDHRINNEFYLDALPIFFKKLGKKSVIFDVMLYVGWGDPHALYEYQKEEYFYTNNIEMDNMSDEEKKLHPLWRGYFEKR